MPTLATGPSRPVRFRASTARKILPQVAERLRYDSPDTFFFVDPPYMGYNEYRHNFKATDFEALAATLKSLKGHFIMTHTDNPEIRSLFGGLHIESTQVTYSTHHLTPGHKSKIGNEVFISNY